jgi:hypothetical protein
MSRPRYARETSKSDKLRLISSRPLETMEHVLHPDSTEVLSCEDSKSREYSTVRSALMPRCQRPSSTESRSKPRQTPQGFMLLPVEERLINLQSFSDLLHPLLHIKLLKTSALAFIFVSSARVGEWFLAGNLFVSSGNLFVFVSLRSLFSCLGECLGITNSELGIPAGRNDDWRMQVTGARQARLGLTQPASSFPP